jgi:hypothetical protein
MDDVLLKSFLGPHVKYAGHYFASNGIAPEYNERTQEMTWRPGRINATTGVVDAPAELVFQVEITPSGDQINQFPVLIGETTVTGKDLFTGDAFFDKLQPFTTILVNDPGLKTEDKQVKL